MTSLSKIRNQKTNLFVVLILAVVTFVSTVDLHYVIGVEFELIELDNECKEVIEKETEKEVKISHKLSSNDLKETVKIIELRSLSNNLTIKFIKEIPTPPPRV